MLKDLNGTEALKQAKILFGQTDLDFLRHYQLSAIEHLQKAVAKGKDRFLFEMATGTGKTLNFCCSYSTCF